MSTITQYPVVEQLRLLNSSSHSLFH